LSGIATQDESGKNKYGDGGYQPIQMAGADRRDSMHCLALAEERLA
jgi:hypothetical protein